MIAYKRRLAVRAGKKEVLLPTFEAMVQTDPLNRRFIGIVLLVRLGFVTTRSAF